MNRLLRWSAVVAGMMFASAHAAPVLLAGKLIGATGVSVGGSLYDVEFLDGTCVAVFSGCDDVSDFTFSTVADASAASSALLAQVFIDGADGSFDSDPTLTHGCVFNPSADGCRAWTPYVVFAIFQANGVDGASAFNVSGAGDTPDLFFTSSVIDSGNNANATWARWTLLPAAAPEPGTLASLAVGLLALALSRRRRAAPIRTRAP